MKHGFLILIQLATLLVRLLTPTGFKAVATENLLLKQQLLIIKRSRHRAPNLHISDRLIFGWLSLLMTPQRITRSAIIIKPATILQFHQALVKKKYLRLFSCTGKGKPGSKGPRPGLVKAIVAIKQHNPRFGCPRIAQIISNTFGIEINKDVVRRILEKHYRPDPNHTNGPSWLAWCKKYKAYIQAASR